MGQFHAYLSSTESKFQSPFPGNRKTAAFIGSDITVIRSSDMTCINTYWSPSPSKNRQMGKLSGWNLFRRSCLSLGTSTNISVPIVASTERWASGTTDDVQGPPGDECQSFDTTRSKHTTLTGNNDEISRVAQAIACPYASYPFAAGFFDNQVLKFTLRLAQDELHPDFFA